MIKILHYGLSSRLGGIETYLYKLYSNINRDEFQFIFMVLGNDEPCYYHELKNLGARFVKITPRRTNMLKNRKEISDVFRDEDFDVIHCHLNSLSYIDPVCLALKFGIPTIVHSRNAGILRSKLSRGLHSFNYLLLPRKSITMLAVSDKAGEWMFGKSSDFKVVNNGVDTGRFAYNEASRLRIRKELGLKDELIVVHLGAMREQKNHMFLLEVFKDFLELQPKARLLLIGDGHLKPDIVAKIRELKLTNSVIIAGERNDVPDILSASDLFLFPSLYEGFPNAVLEAQASGLPCLISDVITGEVQVSDNCKFLSLSKPTSEWAKELGTLKPCRNRHDAIRDVKSKRLSAEDEVREIEDIYRELRSRDSSLFKSS